MERGTHYTLQIKGGIGMKLKFIGADHEVTEAVIISKRVVSIFLLITVWSREKMYLKT